MELQLIFTSVWWLWNIVFHAYVARCFVEHSRCLLTWTKCLEHDMVLSYFRMDYLPLSVIWIILPLGEIKVLSSFSQNVRSCVESTCLQYSILGYVDNRHIYLIENKMMPEMHNLDHCVIKRTLSCIVDITFKSSPEVHFWLINIITKSCYVTKTKMVSFLDEYEEIDLSW